MDNRTFISQYAFSSQNKKHGNLFVDNKVMYSYGHHYPLLFEVNGLTFVNNRGYSNTTAKHIGIAGQQATHNVKLIGSNISFDDVIASLQVEIDSIKNDINKCVREVSQKKTHLIEKLNTVEGTINTLNSTIENTSNSFSYAV